MSELLLSDLKTSIKKREAVIVVGAGISLAATDGASEASWRGLLLSGMQRCQAVVAGLPSGWADRVTNEINSGDIDDMLSAAEKITSKLGGARGGEFSLWLRETVGSLKLADPAVIRALAALNLPIITTNYDDLIERSTGLASATWRDTQRFERTVRGDTSAVLHLHGSWDQPDTVVLGVRSYDLILGAEHAQALIHALRATCTLILVGFGSGLADPNFTALLEWTRRIFSGSEFRHFRLVPSADRDDVIRHHPPAERIHVLSYGDTHADLPRFLATLATSDPSPARASAQPKPRVPAASHRPASHLASYLQAVSEVHGFIRFLGLPHLKDRPDVPIDRLFVEPNIALQYISPDLAEDQWPQRFAIVDMLAEHRSLVILGDPGTGKSTLVSWIAWQLSRPGPNQWKHVLASAVPLPVILRELRLRRDVTWEGLLDAFIATRLGAVLKTRSSVEEMLAEGSVLVLLDGLDEISSDITRNALFQAVQTGMRQYPQALWLVTDLTNSRIPASRIPSKDRNSQGVSHDSKRGFNDAPPLLRRSLR